MLNFLSSYLKFKKGQGLSIETIVLIIILVIVLFVVILIFTGQSNSIFEAIKGFLGLANQSAPGNLTDVI